MTSYARIHVHLPSNFSDALRQHQRDRATQKSLMSRNKAKMAKSPCFPLSLLLFLSLSLSLFLSLFRCILCEAYASECYTRWQIIMAHILSAPRLQGIVPKHTMVPGPVSATHPCPSLLVRARGIISLSLSLRLTPISPSFRILQGCPTKCCSQ